MGENLRRAFCRQLFSQSLASSADDSASLLAFDVLSSTVALDLFYSSANAYGGARATGFLLRFTAYNFSVPLLNSTTPPGADTQRCGGEVLVPVSDASALYAVNSTLVTSVASASDAASIDWSGAVNVSSPNYPHNYENNMDCVWTLRAVDGPATRKSVGYRLLVHMADVALEWHSYCAWDSLTLYERASIVSPSLVSSPN